jgi:hypothetical protein
MVFLELTDREVMAILVWADSNIHGGHWGDGDAIVPEEDIILKKLNRIKNNRLSVNENEVKIMLSWSESTLGIHTMEEANVIEKLNSLMKRDGKS